MLDEKNAPQDVERDPALAFGGEKKVFLLVASTNGGTAEYGK